MLDPARTASRTKKKKKTTSSPLIGAPVQSQDARDARAREMGGKGARPGTPCTSTEARRTDDATAFTSPAGSSKSPGVFGVLAIHSPIVSGTRTL